jgi:putative ABC transport system ATP-binding protein
MSEPVIDNIISVQQVSKQFDTRSGPLTLFSDINLDIKQGDTVSIIGPSGAGKSTFLSLLAGLDLASSGQVLIAGENPQQLSESARADLRANLISFVFQTFHLLPELTALENVCLPLEIRGITAPEKQAQEWLKKVGLGERADHYPNQLSGGEQQRVAIARAFASKPQILFADEPTGNLDEATSESIVKQLFDLNAQQGTTLILITHDNALAKRCQSRYRLQQGRLEAY